MHIGGMVSGGLSWTDVGDVRVLGGFARRFYAAVAERYGAALWEVKGPEPHVAEEVLASFLDGVDVRVGTWDVPDAAVYVDASYEGDLMARLGVSYAVGRESRELYGEAWAGRQPAYRPSKHNFPLTLSPFAGDGSLLPFVREPELDERGWPAERLGEGDGGLQAYGYRVCLTDRDASRIPFTEPEGYDASEFELSTSRPATFSASCRTCCRTGNATSTRSARSRSTCSTEATARIPTATTQHVRSCASGT